MIDKIDTYDERVLDNLVSQYKGSTNLRHILETLGEAIQQLENVSYELLRQLLLENAEGRQLRLLGEADECYRRGLTDAQYRKMIEAHGRALVSKGRMTEIMRIASLASFAAPLWYQQGGTAAFHILFSPDTTFTTDGIQRINEIMDLARWAGVQYSASESAPSERFTLDSGPGLDRGKLARRIDTL